MADDYSSNPSTTGVVPIGGSIGGNLEELWDTDWFKVHLEANKPYIFKLSGFIGGLGTLRDLSWVDFALVDSTGKELALNYASGNGDWTAKILPVLVGDSGDYFISVADLYRKVAGSYTVSAILQPDDDYGAGTTTKGTLALDQPVHAKFEMAGDVDWFKFHAEAGQHYAFSAVTSGEHPSGVGVSLFDASGKAVSGYSYPFEPSQSGDYYVAVYGEAVGSYDLKMKTIIDDYSTNASSPGQLSEGGQASGSIQYRLDRDSFQFTMQAGSIYSFDLDATSGIADNMLVLQAVDSSGKMLDLSSARGPDGVLHVSAAPTQSGTYLLTVGTSYSVDIADGRYVLYSLGSKVDDYGNTIATAGALDIGAQLSGSIQGTQDVDMIKVELQAGVAYNFSLLQQGAPGQSSNMYLNLMDSKGASIATPTFGLEKNYLYVPSISGSYYLGVGAYSGQQPGYTLSAALAPDDYTANNATSGTVAIGAPATGTMEGVGDRDWFSANLNVGNTYWFTLSGSGDTPLNIGYNGAQVRIMDSKGAVVAATDNRILGPFFPVLSFAPTVRDAYYVEVSAPNHQTGTYQLVEQIGLRDDYGNDPVHASRTSLDVPLAGKLELPSDKDVLKFSAVAGTTYRIDLGTPSSGPGLGFSVDLKISEGLQGEIQQRTLLRAGTTSSVLFEAAHTGDYYFTLSSSTYDGHGTQSYVLTTSSYGLDDLPGYSNTSAVLPVNGQLQATINYPDDKDWVKVHLESGRTYVFDMQGWQTGGGTLDTSNYGNGLTLYNSGSSEVARQNYSNSPAEPRLTYTATSTGDYYLEAHGNGRLIGSYTLTATQTNGDIVAPQLLSAAPADGSTGFSPTGKIVLTFSETVALPANASFTLTGGGTTMSLSGNYSVNAIGHTIVIDPSGNLRPGTAYTLQVASGTVIDLAGNKYTGASLSFNTVATVATGTDGNDYLAGKANGQQINGGNGIDTIYYDDSQGSFGVTRGNDNVITVRPWYGGTGDVLTGVERLLFNNQAKALDIDGHGGQAYRLYQAAFNRTPDSAGLGFWMSRMDNGQSLQSVAHDFVASTEFTNAYGSKPSDAAFVNQLYHNVLHRDGEAAGVAHWLQVLGAGTSRENVLVAFSESQENQTALIGQIGNGFWYTPYG